MAAFGIILTGWALRNLRQSGGEDGREVKALLQFAFGWQLTAVFGGLLFLAAAGMEIGNAMMATSASLSHFGLFAAVQEGMAGPEAAGMTAFVFAMPFLVHPFVFFLFGRAMESGERMPAKPVYLLALVGLVGVVFGLAG